MSLLGKMAILGVKNIMDALRLDSYNVTVVNSVVGCGCNGLQFGSETLGDFHDYHFGNPATLVSAVATRLHC